MIQSALLELPAAKYNFLLVMSTYMSPTFAGAVEGADAPDVIFGVAGSSAKANLFLIKFCPVK
jgi:hypothetical protein